jgi:WD40 repeat protein
LYDAVAGKLDLVPRIVGREEKSLEKFSVSPDGRTIAFIGNDGYIILVDAHTKHWIADLKMNGSVRAVTFTPDGEEIIASGSDGDVYRYEKTLLVVTLLRYLFRRALTLLRASLVRQLESAEPAMCRPILK